MSAGLAAGDKGDATYEKWKADSDLRTLTEAAQIEKDPVRMKHVRRAAKERLAETEALKKYAAGKD